MRIINIILKKNRILSIKNVCGNYPNPILVKIPKNLLIDKPTRRVIDWTCRVALTHRFHQVTRRVHQAEANFLTFSALNNIAMHQIQ